MKFASTTRRLSEALYQVYFALLSIRPLGALDLALRRALGRRFNGASSRDDVRIINDLAGRRKRGCAGSNGLTIAPDEDLPCVTVVIVPDDPHDVELLLEAYRKQNYPADRLSLLVVASRRDDRSGLDDIARKYDARLVKAAKDNSCATLNEAIDSVDSPFLLAAFENRLPNANCVRRAVGFALAQRADTAAWQLSPTLTEQVEYCDPVTLETPGSELGVVLVRSAFVREAGGVGNNIAGARLGNAFGRRLRDRGYRLQSIGRSMDFESMPSRRANSSQTGRGRARFATSEARREDQPLPADRPQVSIIIRTHGDRGGWLRESLCSVVNQTYPSLEVIVVEDGGDHCLPIVERFAAKTTRPRNIRHIALPKRGKACAGNAGLEACSGELIGFLDDDDLFLPGHVELLYNALRSAPGAVAAYALAWEAQTLEDDGRPAEGVHYEVPLHMRTRFDRDRLREVNYLPIQAVLFKRACYDQVGGFEPGRSFLEDWALWNRFAELGHFVYLPVVTSVFRTPADPCARIARIRKRERRSIALPGENTTTGKLGQ